MLIKAKIARSSRKSVGVFPNAFYFTMVRTVLRKHLGESLNL